MNALPYLEQFVDLGLLLSVVIVSCFSLYSSKRTNAANYRMWKAELGNLHDSLRMLIEEASSASQELDRTLVRRKHELEGLLLKLEDAEQQLKKTNLGLDRRLSTQRQTVNGSNNNEHDLPNSSWAQPFNKDDALRDKAITGKDDSGLATIASEQEDIVSLSGHNSRTSSSNQEQNATSRGRRFEKESKGKFNNDPVTYQIARRLLAQGQEIHVVSRKLELPVSEVRLIDKSLRVDGGDEDGAVQAKDNARSVSRRRNFWSSEGRETNEDIERDYVLF